MPLQHALKKQNIRNRMNISAKLKPKCHILSINIMLLQQVLYISVGETVGLSQSAGSLQELSLSNTSSIGKESWTHGLQLHII